MQRYRLLLIATIGAIATFTFAMTQRAAAEDITAEEVRTSIERGIAFLKSKQNKIEGNWAEHPGQPGGMTALCTLALLNAGVEPKDESIQKALNYLRGMGKPKMVYSTSLVTMALVAADPSERNADKALIRRNAEYLASIQITNSRDDEKTIKKGSWAYSDSQGNGDNSNTQFALLALQEAERVGVEVREDVYRLALNYWVATQNDTGGWGYFDDQPTTGSMTCAGIASVVICSGKISQLDARVEGNSVRCCGEIDDADKAGLAVENALAWMGRNFSVNSNPSGFSGREAPGRMWLLYYLYGVERVGRTTGRRFFMKRDEKFDWYRMGAEMLVRRGQDKLSGSWTGTGHGENNPLIGTSLALLFLSKGRRPVVIANLQREPADDWNHHRSAIGNLTHDVERRWGRDLTWQTIESHAATAKDLLQAPVMFISGRDSLRLRKEEREHLRAYVDAGGFIFAENCCDGAGFDRDFRALMKELFPDSQLAPLPADHPIWFAETKVVPDPQETPLYGLNSCCRTSVVYCPKDLSCYWELGGVRDLKAYPDAVRERIERAMGIGANVIAYATGRDLRDKLDLPQLVGEGASGDPASRNTLYVSKLGHSGGSDDAPSALSNLLAVMQQEIGVESRSVGKPIAIADEQIFNYPIAFMHGRRSFRLTEAERKNLREFIERGGFLFADAICANQEFVDSFRREMAATFRDARLTPLPASHPLLTQEFRGYDITKVSLRDPTDRAEGDPLKAKIHRTAPTLEAIEIDGRLAVIFSPYDLSCALENSPSLECKGYDRRDAAKIGVNVLLYALQQ